MTQDLYYVDSGYLTPDAGYYVYTADAEAAVSSAATMTATVGVIKNCVSTITCQATVSAVISHIHGADLVAFSNAAIATEINVIKATNVALTSVFSAAIDGSRGIYVSAQADSTASISIANFRVRYSQAAHSAAFSLAAEGSVIAGVIIKEAAANLTTAVTLIALAGKRQRFEIAQVVLSSQSTEAARTRNINATIVSQSIVIATVGVVKEVISSQSNLFTSTVIASRTREGIITLSGAFTPTLTVSVVKNSFAVLDSVSTVLASATATKSAITILTSIASVNANGRKFTGSGVALASQFTATAVGIKPSRIVLPTLYSGGVYSNISIESSGVFGNRLQIAANSSTRIEPTAFVNTGASSWAGINDSYIWKSTDDGATWTRSSHNGGAFSKFLYLNNTYVLCTGTSASFKTSSDGITWTTRTPSITAGYTARVDNIAYANARWIILGDNGDLIYTFHSSNLTSWTRGSTQIYNSTSGISIYEFQDFATNGSSTIVISFFTVDVSGTNLRRLWSSTDSITWTLRLSVNVGSSPFRGPGVISYSPDSGTWLAPGYNSDGNGNNYIYRSSNLTSWTTLEQAYNYEKGFIQELSYVNSSWVSQNADGNFYSSSNNGSSWTLLNAVKVKHVSSRYFAYSSTKILTYIKNFNQAQLTTNNFTSSISYELGNVSGLQGHIEYNYLPISDNDKFRNWKTIDFRLKVDLTGVSGQLTLIESDKFRVTVSGQSANATIAVYFSDNLGVLTTTFTSATWTHFRIANNATNWALYKNGSKVGVSQTTPSLDSVDVPIIIANSWGSDNDGFNTSVDELLITDELLTSPSAASFTVPTTPYSNTASTDLLLHFDSNFQDDASQLPRLLSGVANLTSVFTQTSQAVKSASAVASLTTVATMNAVAAKNAEIILTAFGNASLTSTITRIRSTDSTQSTSIIIAVNAARTRTTSSAQSSQFTQATSAVKTVNPTVATDAIFSELVAVARTGAGFVQLDAQATMLVTAVKTARISLSVNSQFTQTTDSVKSVKTTASLASVAAQATTVGRIRNQVLVYAVNSQLEANAGEITQFAANLTTNTALVCETSRTQLFSIGITSQATVDATILRIRNRSSSLASAFTQISQTNNSKTARTNASLASQVSQTATAGTIKTSAIATDAIFSELAAVAKTGQGFITLEVQVVQTAQAVKTAVGFSSLSTTATVSATATRIQTASASLNTAANFTVTGTFATVASANLSVSTALACQAVKNVSAISLEASAGTLTASAQATKRAAASLSVLAFELALGSRTQRASASLVSASTVSAKIGGSFRFRAALQGSAAQLTIIDVVHIDADLTWMITAEDRAYSISADTRTYSIVEEDRDYLIVQEDRTYAVTRELLTTELQGV